METLHHAINSLSKIVKPKVQKLASEGRLVAFLFEEFHPIVYPGAPEYQVREMRTAFFAGAAELHAIQMYAFDLDTEDPTEADHQLYSDIVAEIEEFHEKALADGLAHLAQGQTKQ